MHEQSPAPDCCSLGSGPLPPEDAERYAALFKVLADPARLRLLSRLAAEGCEPMSVTALTEYSGLRKLAEAGLLKKSRTGRTVTHEICPAPFAELRTVLQMD